MTYTAKQIEMLQQTCRHFNGIQHEACKVGVLYAKVRDATQRGPYRWPCLTVNNAKATTTCAQFSPRTVEEIAAEDARFEEAMAAIADRSKNNQCIHCGEPVASRRMEGRCEYVEPCGHRQGQKGDGDD